MRKKIKPRYIYYVAEVMLYTTFLMNIGEFNLKNIVCFLCFFGVDLISRFIGEDKGFDMGYEVAKGRG